MRLFRSRPDRRDGARSRVGTGNRRRTRGRCRGQSARRGGHCSTCYLPLLEGALPCEEERDPLSRAVPARHAGTSRRRGVRAGAGEPSVDVVVCVHNALEDLRLCLWSLLAKTGRRFRLILVNDGSDAPTTRFLRAFAERHPAATLIEREEPPHGYTLAANRGLEASSSDYVILLNSDTVVSAGWLARLIAHGEARARSVSSGRSRTPRATSRCLSSGTAAAWADERAAGLADRRRHGPDPRARRAAHRHAPAVPQRLLLRDQARRDRRRRPARRGALRGRLLRGERLLPARARAGFELAVADDAYVHHAKSRSFGPDGRADLARRNYEAFLEKHGRSEIEGLVSAMEADRRLEAVQRGGGRAERLTAGDRPAARRGDRGSAADRVPAPGPRPRRLGRVAFDLPGGARGCAALAYRRASRFRSGIASGPRLIYEDADEIFQTFSDTDDLVAKTADAEVISATHYKSVAMLKAHPRRPHGLPARLLRAGLRALLHRPLHRRGGDRLLHRACQTCCCSPSPTGCATSSPSATACSWRRSRPSIDRELFAPGVGRRLQDGVRCGCWRWSGPARRAASRWPRVAVLERLRERFAERGRGQHVRLLRG